jgi:hypothetical protein
MPSRIEPSGRCALVLLATLVAPWPVAAHAPASLHAATGAGSAAGDSGAHEAIIDGEVQSALKALHADPLMGGMERHRRLHWRTSEPRDSKPTPWLEGLLRWLGQAGAWIASSARALVLVAVTICVALLAVVAWRAWRRQPRAAQPGDGSPPTHVRGLDIRPDELPADVPAAARALWRSGGQRAALVLLYRSLLSRLAHGFHVPILDSSTEADCLSLARGRLPEPGLAYAGEFIRAWLAAMYAGQWPDAELFESLCAGHWQLQGGSSPGLVPAGAPA